MTILEQVCASGGNNAVIDSLELTCPAWASPIRLVQGYFDMQLGFGDGTFATFTAAPIGLVLPSRNADGNQKLTFAIDNVMGEAQRRLDDALAAGQQVKLTYRRYLESDLYGPSENPFYATVLGGGMTGATVQLSAGFQNILGYKWPRSTYDLDYCPDLAYL